MMQQRYTTISLGKKLTGRYFRQKLINDSVRHSDAIVPQHGSYGNLLFDPRWKAKRTEVLLRDNHCCVICNSADQLQVHHRQYQFIKKENAFKMPWAYSDHLLITLCKSCHQRGHNKFKVPIIIL